jgi:hypothetical protein
MFVVSRWNEDAVVKLCRQWGIYGVPGAGLFVTPVSTDDATLGCWFSFVKDSILAE